MESALSIPKFLTGNLQEEKDSLVGYAKRLEGRITTKMYLDADRYISENVKLFDNIHAYLGNRTKELGRRVAATLGKSIPDHAPGHAGKYVNLVVALVNLGQVPPAHTEDADGTLVRRHNMPQLAADAAAFTQTSTEEDIANNIKLVTDELERVSSPLAEFMKYVDTYVDKGGKDTRYIARLFAASPVDVSSGDSAGMAIGYLVDKHSLMPQLVGGKFKSAYAKLPSYDREDYRKAAADKLATIYKMREAVATFTLDKLLGK